MGTAIMKFTLCSRRPYTCQVCYVPLLNIACLLHRPHILALLYAGEQEHTNLNFNGPTRDSNRQADCVNVEQFW